MQSSSEQPLVGEERYVTTVITAAKETSDYEEKQILFTWLKRNTVTITCSVYSSNQ